METRNETARYCDSRCVEHEALFAPGLFFKSCHASSVLPLADGTVLAAYFAGEYERADDVAIWLSRRVNGRWMPPARIAKVNDCAHWNPVLMPVTDGVRIVFKVGRDIPAWESYTMRSRDGGRTWTQPVRYAGVDRACGPVRSKPVLLSNGWLLAPNSTETETTWLPRVDVSADEGANFRKLADIPVNLADAGRARFIAGKGAIQPTLWESARGRVHALLRTTCGAIFRSDSDDFGASWCEAYATPLPNNNSGIDAALLDGALYLAMNPTRGNWASRTPLVVLRSDDNGAHFSRFVTLENEALDADGGAAEFSYPAIVAADGMLHVTYTRLRQTIAYTRLRPT